jgi:hypothetical protein
MTWVLAPEPAPWLAQLPTLLGAGRDVHVLAPWALPRAPWLPAALRRAWAQRELNVPEAYRVWGVPGWSAVEAGMRLTARSAAATFAARFALRRRLGQAAALLPLRAPLVVAPSLAAREAFARARRRGGRCVLVEDLPSLRELHADLDAAAEAHPGEAFLRNHRASAADVARQEAERVLADELWVRSPLARARLLAAGHAATKVRLLIPAAHVAPTALTEARAPIALLAGPALARSGLHEALAALDALPGWTLRVRPVDATPTELLRHPRVQRVTSRSALDGVAVVLAPAWCESHPEELAHAWARAIPIVATDRCEGALPVHLVPRGDVAALVEALGAALRAQCAAPPHLR